ncbi:MarR family transcriptional regulator [Paenibacillus oenotherae]|uniref:MarR family transcriptional regulator n=1 Tax=Paenibacillus oenotherae TaxID=1435645 RepID=A0ABS7D5B7_9BACL|nr:MarR family transcriptional regulator [Paenibacillus oenotherae]MBW7475142.1 MarR family transcriptional regulator [Paenibacillus oenotherae]
MNRNELLHLDNQLCFALYACAREVTKLYRPFLDELGLTYTQYVTMLVLWETDGIPVKALGERLYLDSGTLTPLLKKLQAAGLIHRERDTADERSVIVRLTEQGRAMQQLALAIPDKVFCQTSLQPEEVAQLREQLHKLTSTIHQCERSSPGSDLN